MAPTSKLCGILWVIDAGLQKPLSASLVPQEGDDRSEVFFVRWPRYIGLTSSLQRVEVYVLWTHYADHSREKVCFWLRRSHVDVPIHVSCECFPHRFVGQNIRAVRQDTFGALQLRCRSFN